MLVEDLIIELEKIPRNTQIFAMNKQGDSFNVSSVFEDMVVEGDYRNGPLADETGTRGIIMID